MREKKTSKKQTSNYKNRHTQTQRHRDDEKRRRKKFKKYKNLKSIQFTTISSFELYIIQKEIAR